LIYNHGPFGDVYKWYGVQPPYLRILPDPGIETVMDAYIDGVREWHETQMVMIIKLKDVFRVYTKN